MELESNLLLFAASDVDQKQKQGANDRFSSTTFHVDRLCRSDWIQQHGKHLGEAETSHPFSCFYSREEVFGPRKESRRSIVKELDICSKRPKERLTARERESECRSIDQESKYV